MGCQQVSNKKEKKEGSKPGAPNQNLGNKKIVVSLNTSQFRNKMTINLKDDVKWEKEFSLETKLKEIIETFNTDTKSSFFTDNSVKWYVNGKLLEPDQSLKSVFPTAPSTKKGEPEVPVFNNIKLTIEFTGLSNVAHSYLETLSNDTNYIGKPWFSKGKLSVFCYDKATSKFKVIVFSDDVEKTAEIENYSKSSAYCSGKDKLFISGGELSGAKLTNFWIVDLKESDNNLMKHETGLLTPKSKHSMIYIPNKYVFIVGGNDLKTFYYSIDEDVFKPSADLHETRSEPSLCWVDNFILYAFSNGKNANSELTFEKINLKKEKEWIVVKPIMKNNIMFQQKLFGVTYMQKSNKVLFLGGITIADEQKYSFEYDTNTNEISESTVEFTPINFANKTFMPLNDQNSFNFPNFSDVLVSTNVVYDLESNTVQTIPIIPPEKLTNQQVARAIESMGVESSLKITASGIPRQVKQKKQKKKLNFSTNLP